MSDSAPVEDAQADRANVTADKRPFSKHWIVLGLLVVANATFGAWFNPTSRSRGDVGDICNLMKIGFIITQPILFALWAAFAPQRFYQRFLWAFLLCSLVAFIEELGNLWLHYSSPDPGCVMVLQLIVFILLTVVLLLVRRFLGWRFIHSQMQLSSGDYQANQFGIKHLIWLTTITAITFALIRSLMILNTNFRWPPSIANAVGGILLYFAIFIPIIIVPWFTMTFRGNSLKLIAFAVILLGIIDSAIYIILKQLVSGARIDILEPMLFMQLGGCLSVLINTIVLRLCGYRMIRERKGAGLSQAIG